IDPATVKRLSALQTSRTIVAMAFDWGIIAAAIAVSQWARNPLVYLLAIAVIGGRMHGFGVLLHEFAHFRFLGNNKALNDRIGDIFIAWPILATVASYRQNHLAHHRYTNTDKDPDWVIKLGNRKFIFPKAWQ